MTYQPLWEMKRFFNSIEERRFSIFHRIRNFINSRKILYVPYNLRRRFFPNREVHIKEFSKNFLYRSLIHRLNLENEDFQLKGLKNGFIKIDHFDVETFLQEGVIYED